MAFPKHKHDYDRLLIGGGVACVICDEIEPGSEGRYPTMDPPLSRGSWNDGTSSVGPDNHATPGGNRRFGT